VQPLSARSPNVSPNRAAFAGPLSARNGGSRNASFTVAAQQLLQPSHVKAEPVAKSTAKPMTQEDLKWAFNVQSGNKATGLSVGQAIGLVPLNEASGKGRKKKQDVGSLMMRGEDRQLKNHGNLKTAIDTRWMSAKDRELHTVCEMIGQKAAMKYKNVREALRFVDADHDGFVTLSEVNYFFRAYDCSSESAASHLFNRLDPKRIGEIDYSLFVDYMGPYIRGEPPGSNVEDQASETSSRESTPQPTPQAATKGTGVAGAKNTTPMAQMEWNVQDWMGFLGRKSSERFSHVMELVRHVDRDYDGSISRMEMRHFFSIFGLDNRVADKCFASMLKPREPEVDYMDFMRAIAPHLDLPGVEAVLHQGGGMGGKRIPVKQRMGAGASLFEEGAEEEATTEEQEAALAKRQEMRTLRLMMQDIKRKLELKFRHARDAFRGLDLDKDGSINPSEMRAFLRGFGYDADAANSLFALLDEEGNGEIDYSHFMSNFEQVVMPNGGKGRGRPEPFGDKHLNREVAEVARIVGENLFTKHRKVNDAFRMLDLNGDGHISREELRSFVRSINMAPEKSDRLFQALDTDLTGMIPYETFMHMMGPMIQPGISPPGEQPAQSQMPPMLRFT